MKPLKPNLENLPKSHVELIHDVFESIWVEYLHTQKKRVKRSSVLRRNDTLKVRNIDAYFRYPASKEVVNVCNELGIKISDDNRITHSIQMRINRELKNLNYPNRIMIEHIGGGVKELLEKFELHKFDVDLEVGTNEVKEIHYEHTNGFYRFEKGTKPSSALVNRSTPYSIEEALNEI